jgi:hypothetical protein
MTKKTLIQIGDNDYEVQFPNVGQLQDIEAMKIALTNGRYVEMALSGLKTFNFALDSADAISYFSVLIPDLKNDLKVKSWRELDPFVGKTLIKAYKGKFMEWYKPIVDELYSFDEDEDSTDDDGEAK